MGLTGAQSAVGLGAAGHGQVRLGGVGAFRLRYETGTGLRRDWVLSTKLPVNPYFAATSLMKIYIFRIQKQSKLYLLSNTSLEYI